MKLQKHRRKAVFLHDTVLRNVEAHAVSSYDPFRCVRGDLHRVTVHRSSVPGSVPVLRAVGCGDYRRSDTGILVCLRRGVPAYCVGKQFQNERGQEGIHGTVHGPICPTMVRPHSATPFQRHLSCRHSPRPARHTVLRLRQMKTESVLSLIGEYSEITY